MVIGTSVNNYICINLEQRAHEQGQLTGIGGRNHRRLEIQNPGRFLKAPLSTRPESDRKSLAQLLIYM